LIASGGLKPPAGWKFKIANCSRTLRLWQPQKVPGIGSEAVAAGNGAGAAFAPPPQLAAEAEGSTGAEDWQPRHNRSTDTLSELHTRFRICPEYNHYDYI
jgi:hypothetical protein